MVVDNHHEAKKVTTINGTNRNTFDNLSKATSFAALSAEYAEGTYSVSYYNRYNGVSYKPFDLKGQNFGFNLPDDATPISCTLAVRMRITEAINVDVPSVKFNLKSRNNLNNTNSYHGTGWHNGYYVNGTPLRSGKREKLSKGWWLFEYEFPYQEFMKGDFDPSDFLNENFSVDLRFRDASVGGNYDYWCQFQIAYMYMRVDYVLPNHQIRFVELSDDGNVVTGETFYVDAIYTQSEKDAIHGGNIPFDVSTQWGEEILNYSTDGTSTYNPTTKKWTVDSTGIQKHTLHLTMKSHVIEENTLLFNNANKCSFTHDTYVGYGVDGGFDGIRLAFDGAIKQYTKGCMYVIIEGYSSDNLATYTLSCDHNFEVIGWEIVEESGVSINSQNGAEVTLNVPAYERFSAYLRVCFIPYAGGTNTFTVHSDDTGHEASLTADFLEGTVFHISSERRIGSDNEIYFYCPPHDIHVRTARVVSTLTTNSTILPFRADTGDAVMYQSGISFNLKEYEDLDYIGCVPLQYSHFDPKSTYKDKLLNTNYKNKRYMGKELAADEEITLNVRLPPRDVTTIQGLIDMDKPIPINTCHTAFEGDALNHRGWAEIYSIVSEKTNPLYYKCDIDVKYLTHNLNTRLNIERGNPVSNYPISNVMYFRVNSGDSLSTTDNFFVTNTDGTYQYITDVENDMSNQFSINNGEHLRVSSREKLANISRIAFEWNSAIINEFKENNISRIVKLVDKDNNSVFEYEYTDYEFEYDSFNNVNNISANVVYRIKTVNGWDNVNSTINLRMVLSDEIPVVLNDNQQQVSANAQRNYGSTIHLELNNNKLKLIDEGFNGKEVSTENAIDLQGEDYWFVVEWKNNNGDAETSDCICYFDFVVEETMLSSEFATKYHKCIVSPFPVAKKHLLFTRDAEEGTLYYYEDDGEEFSYLIEPYYQYMNGTDLVVIDTTTGEKISIFNLNYGYEVVYIQNGLVRLGFNRINGQVYLAKYDPLAGMYITTHNLQLEKYSDINTKSISDDKIEIQASDSIFTIWRGHPYIMITHPTEDILIDTRFNRVWAEGVGQFPLLGFPEYWDLQNTSNLLPPCVGGVNELKKSCLDVEEQNIVREYTELQWDNVDFSNIVVGTDYSFTVKGAFNSTVIFDDIDCSRWGKSIFGEFEFTETTNHNVAKHLLLSSDKMLIKPIETISFYSKLTDRDRIGLSGKTINYTVSNGVVEKETSSSTTDSDGNSDYTYTGKGLGWLNVQADSNTTYYTLKSDKYNFLDAIFRDVGNNYITSTLSKTVESNSIFLQNTNNDYGVMSFSETPATNPYTIFRLRGTVTYEFDIINYTGSFWVRLDGSTNKELFRSTNTNVPNHSHIKITNNGTSIDYWINGVKRTITDVTDEARMLRIRVNSTTDEVGTFRYANMCYYYDTPNSMFFDKGMTEYENTNWRKSNNGLSVNTADDGKTVSMATGTGVYYANSTDSVNFFLDNNWIVEFDVVSFTGSPVVRITEETTSLQTDWNFSGKGVVAGSHIKLEYSNNVLTHTVDGNDPVSTPTQSFTGNLSLGLRMGAGVSLKFKNFNVYSPSDDTVQTIDISTTKSEIQTDETTLITVTPRGENGYPVYGASVDLYRNSYKLATLNTGSMGYATYEYTGTALGDRYFIGKNKLISSSRQYILDCMMRDEAIDGGFQSEEWFDYNNRLSDIYSDQDGTTLEAGSSTDVYYYCNLPNTPKTSVEDVSDFNAPFCIELDVVEWVDDNYSGLYLSDGTNNQNVLFHNRVTSNNSHVKVTYDGEKINMWVDDVQKIADTSFVAENPLRVALKVRRGTSMKYRNWKIYPI